jgi:hypothetical protein
VQSDRNSSIIGSNSNIGSSSNFIIIIIIIIIIVGESSSRAVAAARSQESSCGKTVSICGYQHQAPNRTKLKSFAISAF